MRYQCSTGATRVSYEDHRSPGRPAPFEPRTCSLGGRMAPMDRHRAEKVDHGAACCRTGLEAARRASLDLQEVRRVRRVLSRLSSATRWMKKRRLVPLMGVIRTSRSF